MRYLEKFVQMGMLKALLIASAILIVGIVISGCSSLPKIANADELCKDWRRITISKNDVLEPDTAKQIEDNNKVRPVWGCSRTENKAAS